VLKLHYEQIRSCSDEQRDHLSQKIVILQAIKTDNKSTIPDYLKCWNQGYMYFSHITFIPFLKTVNNTGRSSSEFQWVEGKQLQIDKSMLVLYAIYIVTACIYVFLL